jgi:hypothetical protein
VHAAEIRLLALGLRQGRQAFRLTKFKDAYVVFSLNFCFSSSALSLSLEFAFALSCSIMDNPSVDFDLEDAAEIVNPRFI